MKIYYVTTHAGKVDALQRSFAAYQEAEIVQLPLELPEPRADDVQEIAKEKVFYAYRQLKQPVVVMDAGFYIPSLNGFPRAYVKFALETIGIEGILKLVAGKDRHCEFRECLAYLDPTLDQPRYFLGQFRGTLAHHPQGILHNYAWSALWLIFIPTGQTTTLAEMNYDEYVGWYNQVSEQHAPDKMFAQWIMTTPAE